MKSKITAVLFLFFFVCFAWGTSLSSIAQFVRIGTSANTIDFDTILMIPRYVEWTVCPADLGKVRREPAWKFTRDPRSSCKQPTHDDYTNSHFDRGHMLPAMDRSVSRDAMRQTFYVTNICPQRPALNRGEWKKIEDATRKVAANGHRVRVQVWPVFTMADTLLIGRNRVAVPHGFVKTIRLAENDSILYTHYFYN